MFGSEVDIVHIFGVPLTVFNYSSQVFPPLLMAAVLGPLYKGLKRIIPENVQLIFVPFLAMLIMIPLTAFLIGPIGVYAGAGLANCLKSINDFSPLIFAIVIPLAYPFMVPLGLHWPINAIMLLNIQTLGYDFIQGPMGAWNFACFGATAGVLLLAWRERDAQMRQTATGALAAGLLGGISEPSLYGIHLRFKRIYPRMLVGLSGRRCHHRHRRRCEDQRLRVHLAADHPGVHQHGAVRHRGHRGVPHRDDPGDHLRLPHPRAAGRVRGRPGARRGPGDRTPGRQRAARLPPLPPPRRPPHKPA